MTVCDNPECGSFECSVPDDHEHWFITLPEVKGHRIKATLLDADTGQPTGDPVLVEAAAMLGFDVQFPETPDDDVSDLAGFEIGLLGFKRVTMDVQFQEVDPDLLGILTGGVMGNPPPPTFGISVAFPARRRTFWEWLRRQPKHHAGTYYVPNARLATEEEMNDEH